MNRKIETPYDYLDYRAILNDDYWARTTTNHSYSLRAYSRDLDVSPGFLSDVLRGKKELGVATGRNLFSKIGFEAGELDYIENLIHLKSSTNELTRQEASTYVKSRYNRVPYIDKPEYDGYLKSFAHFAVYGIVRKVSALAEVLSFAEGLMLSRDQVEAALADLLREGYLVNREGALIVADETAVIKSDGKILAMLGEFSSSVNRLIRQKGGIKAPERVAQSLVLGLDDSAFATAVESHKQYVAHLHRLGLKSKRPTRFVFVSEVFLAVGPSVGQGAP